MPRAAVVRHLVLYHLHAKPVRRIHQFAEVLHGAEVRLHVVEIDRVIAVVWTRVGCRVAVHRGRPDARDAEVLQVRQPLADAAQVAAVVGEHGIHRLRRREAVGHQEINNIVRGEPLKPACRRQRCVEREVERRLRAFCSDMEAVLAGLRVGPDIDVGEQVSAVGGTLPHLDAKRTRFASHGRIVQSAAREQHLDRVSRVVCPPVRRFHFCNRRRRQRNRRKHQREARQFHRFATFVANVTRLQGDHSVTESPLE
jgi:hypothetical protein